MSEIFSLMSGSANLCGEYAGRGEAMVFLHAGVADRRMWQPQLHEFQKSHRVIAYDLRGFGETTSPDETFSHTGDLARVLDYLNIGRCILVGSSLGGRVAIDFSLLHPDRINALILLAPAISGAPNPETYPATVQNLLDKLDVADEEHNLVRVNEIEANLWLDGPLSEEGRVQGEARDLFLDMNGLALSNNELTLGTYSNSAFDRISEFEMPCLIIAGSLDFPHVLDRCEYLATKIAAAIYIKIPDVAHLPGLEKPADVNNCLRKFLNPAKDAVRNSHDRD